MDGVSVTQTNINESIDYLKREFMQPLKRTGEDLIEENKILNIFLKNENIDAAIAEQQKKLNEMEEDLNSICEKAGVRMEESAATVGKNVAEITDSMEA